MVSPNGRSAAKAPTSDVAVVASTHDVPQLGAMGAAADLRRPDPPR